MQNNKALQKKNKLIVQLSLIFTINFILTFVIYFCLLNIYIFSQYKMFILRSLFLFAKKIYFIFLLQYFIFLSFSHIPLRGNVMLFLEWKHKQQKHNKE